jgi:hypothetical protein
VPLLAPVPLPAQVEILADVWVRHRALATRRANLLDFAVLQAASATAEALVRVGGFVLRTLLQECVPWDIGAYRLDAVTADRIAELPTWGDWPEEDAFGWHSAADLADQPHRLAAPLLAAANRTEASPAIERHLAGQALSSASYTIYKVDVQWYHYPKRLLHTDALRRAARTRFAGLTCHAEDVGAGAEASRHAGWCAPRWVTRL